MHGVCEYSGEEAVGDRQRTQQLRRVPGQVEHDRDNYEPVGGAPDAVIPEARDQRLPVYSAK